MYAVEIRRVSLTAGRSFLYLVPAPAVRLMKRRVLSRPGVNSLMVLLFRARAIKRKMLIAAGEERNDW